MTGPTGTTQARGRFFEDFKPGAHLRHATPRTVTTGDAALHLALTGSRFPLHCSQPFAQACGLPAMPIDDLLVFNIVFGKTVPDVSANAIANLGYADGRFGVSVFPGDTLQASSTVLGRRQLSGGKAGIVWVRTEGTNQRGEPVLSYVRWAMVARRAAAAEVSPPKPIVPDLPAAVDGAALAVPAGFDLSGYDRAVAGVGKGWDAIAAGERLDHGDGMTVEEAEHQMATRLYQNTARVHFDLHRASGSRFGRRLVYGGHVIALARALSFNGLAHACRIAGLNGGRHSAPVFAGDTVYAWSQVLAKLELGRGDLGALRLRTVATKNRPCDDFPDRSNDGKDHPDKVLELDYWVWMPRFARP